MQPRTVTAPASKSVAVIGLLSALYVVGGVLVGNALGPLLRGYPAHFLRGFLMSSAAAYAGRAWSATMMGAIAGVIMLVTIPAPAPYLPLASLAAGVAYDTACRAGGSYVENSRKKGRILIATSLSSISESIVALSILTALGIIEAPLSIIILIWLAAMAGNILISNAGAAVTLWILIRRKII